MVDSQTLTELRFREIEQLTKQHLKISIIFTVMTKNT